MIATFEERRATVRALQLTPETADELCRWTNGYLLGPDRWIHSEGCWRVSALRWYPPVPMNGSSLAARQWLLRARQIPPVGIRTRDGERVVEVGQWVVQANGNGGGFRIVTADRFHDMYQPVVEVAPL